MSGLGLVIAPLSCGVNAAIAATLRDNLDPRRALATFCGAVILTALLCFPLGLFSETVVRLWNAGEFVKARWSSAFFGAGALFLAWGVAPDFRTNNTLVFTAALLIPGLWSFSLVIFALLARAPKSE